MFLVVIFGIAMIACDTGGNGGNEVPEVPPKYEGPVWTAVDDSPFRPLRGGIPSETQNINAITYGEEVFVAGGERSLGSNIAWSNNGNNWMLVVDDDNPFSYQKVSFSGEGVYYNVFRNINTIAYGGGKFVVGSSSGMAWSDTGKSWTKVESNNPLSQNRIYAIVYGGTDENGIFVAGGSNGEMAWSENGQGWTGVANSTFGSDDITAIAFGVLDETGRFIAAGGKGKMAWSQSDGKNWTAVNNPPFGSSSISGITYGGGKFVAVSYDGIAYSDFGQSWTKVENSSGWSLSAVTYGKGMFVAVGDCIVISSDGVTWTVVPDEYDGNISARAIAYGNGKFVIGGWDGKIAYSD
jgi:photosystem II stability/assembly factor-like uncharacterized protein